MLTPLKLESLAGGQSSVITEVRFGSLSLGREPENDVVVESDGISRRHGLIHQAGEHWVYRDLGSTNKSWVNGLEVSGNQIRLLRSHDIIQLADFPLRVTEVPTSEGPEDADGDSYVELLVFVSGQFDRSIALRNTDSRFVVGGPDSDFSLEGVSYQAPLIVIARFSGRIELTVGTAGPTVLVNGVSAGGTISLVDRNEIEFLEMRVVVSDPHSARTSAEPVGQGAMSLHNEIAVIADSNGANALASSRSAIISGEWKSESVRRKVETGRHFVFGQEMDEGMAGKTASFKPGITASHEGFPVSPLHRFTGGQEEETSEVEGSSLSDRLVVIIGFITFVLVIFAVVFYLMQF